MRILNQNNRKTLTIEQWSDADKPREKLLAIGKKSLSSTELLAILIRTGSTRKNALELARELLASTGNDLGKIGKMSPENMMNIEGIGPAKAVTITAALELGRRVGTADRTKMPKVEDSAGAYSILKPLIAELEHEEFYLLYLNNSHRVICTQQLSKGGITSTIVDIRLILKKALELGAIALIIAHNHPSGNLKPSAADKALTKKLVDAAKLMDLKVLDHLILTYNDYFSFADAELI